MSHKFPWSDYEIRSFYFDAKDPVEQVFVVADLCATQPITALKKLCEMGLIADDLRVRIVEEIQTRKAGCKREPKISVVIKKPKVKKEKQWYSNSPYVKEYSRLYAAAYRKDMKENHPEEYRRMRDKDNARRREKRRQKGEIA